MPNALLRTFILNFLNKPLHSLPRLDSPSNRRSPAAPGRDSFSTHSSKNSPQKAPAKSEKQSSSSSAASCPPPA